MRIYENPQKTSENRKAARSYYIPGGVSEYQLLNGMWKFAYFNRDIDVHIWKCKKQNYLCMQPVSISNFQYYCLYIWKFAGLFNFANIYVSVLCNNTNHFYCL